MSDSDVRAVSMMTGSAASTTRSRSQDLESAMKRQADVEEHEVVVLRERVAEGVSAVVDDRARVAGRPQALADEAGDRYLVLGDQDGGHQRYSLPLRTRGSLEPDLVCPGLDDSHHDAAAVGGRDCPDDRQAETRAVDAAAGVGATEALEDAVAVRPAGCRALTSRTHSSTVPGAVRRPDR